MIIVRDYERIDCLQREQSAFDTTVNLGIASGSGRVPLRIRRVAVGRVVTLPGCFRCTYRRNEERKKQTAGP